MKMLRQNPRCAALTVFELLVVVVAVVILAGLILPTLARTKSGHRVTCASNLKQIGIAFRVWESDYGDMYPQRYFTNQPGELQSVNATNMFRYFQVMSNEINNAQVLVCPQDKERVPASSFGSDFNNSHVSYFLGLDADETFPRRLLSGDRHLANGAQPIGGILDVTTNQAFAWTKKNHEGIGYLLFADGSVGQATTAELRNAVAQTGLATNRLAMPGP
jgi:hypothetical protein